MSIKWDFKKDAYIYTEEFWYDITDGGYIKPLEILDDKEQAKKLQEAIDLLRSFEQAIDDRQEN